MKWVILQEDSRNNSGWETGEHANMQSVIDELTSPPPILSGGGPFNREGIVIRSDNEFLISRDYPNHTVWYICKGIDANE